MPDYSKSSIYKIVCNISGKIYIGSTCQPLHQRLGGHVRCYNKGKYYSSSEIIAGGNYSIILIQEYPCENKQQLLRKEREYIESLECVNICKRPIISIEEKKKRRDNNKDKMKEYHSEYYNTNKDKAKDKAKEYREINKDKIKECKSQKVICSICSKEMRKDCLLNHKRKIHKPDYTLIE